MSKLTVEEIAKEEEEEFDQWIGIEARRAIQALMWYDYNVSKTDQIHEIYGDKHHWSYLEEKVDLLERRGLLWLWGQLDAYHQKKCITAIYKKYRNDVAQSIKGGGKT